MKLIVENFGPIKKGEIDLNKKFYAFVGYNNTGKTYMSQLLWGIFNYDNTLEYRLYLKKAFQGFSNYNIYKDEFSTNVMIDNSLINLILTKISEFTIDRVIPKTFNSDKVTSNLKINFSLQRNEFKELIKKKIENDDFSIYNHFLKIILNTEGVFFEFKSDNELRRVFSLPEDFELNNFIIDNTLNLLFMILFDAEDTREVIFIPANRGFYPSFYKYLFKVEQEYKNNVIDEIRKSVENAKKIDLNEFNKLYEPYRNSYTKPIEVLFSKLFDLNFRGTGEQGYYDLADELSQLMGGNIVNKQVEALGITEFFTKLIGKDIELPMYLSSSSVNQLATLYLYFRYWVYSERNFLFIDEPEENLHPSNQIKLTNLLLKFATRNNNRVLITTHSPLIAENINNYLYLSLLRKQQPNDFEKIIEENRLNIDTEIDISPEEIGIYFFKDGKITDLAQESTDWGINFRDFYRVEQEVANIGKVLTDYLYYHEDEENILDKQPAK